MKAPGLPLRTYGVGLATEVTVITHDKGTQNFVIFHVPHENLLRPLVQEPLQYSFTRCAQKALKRFATEPIVRKLFY